MELTQEQKDLLDEMDNELDIDMTYAVLNELPESIDDFMDYAQERISEIEVIYYAKAMEYLQENDPSLQESLGLAHDMGYTADKLNSELLATILTQQNASEALGDYRDRVEELFYPEAN